MTTSAAMCRDSRVTGAFNSDCPEVATHTLRRKPLCTEHWKDALNAGRTAAASQASYSQMLGNMSRRG